MSDQLKSIGFAVGLCLVLGLLLTAAATGLHPMQERNREVDRQKNILQAVGLIEEHRIYSPEQIQSVYDTHILRLGIDAAGRIIDPEIAGSRRLLPLYLHADPTEGIRAYILPISTKGLWGTIQGYLAIDDDGATIIGFSVFQHAETPGLGGEIEKNWFQENFVGKKLVDRHGNFVSVKVAKGDVEKMVPPEKRAHYVDGISGATLTGKFLSQGLQDILLAYEPVSVRFRQNNLRCRIQEKIPECEDETDAD